MSIPDDPKPAPAANLEAPKWFDKEIMGVPVMPGLIGGGVAELSAALVAKIPQLSSLTGGNPMLTDLLIALGLGYFGKKHEWAKYGAMFMVYAAFQPEIQALVASVTNGFNGGGSNNTGNTGNTTAMAQESGDVNAMIPSEIAAWMNS